MVSVHRLAFFSVATGLFCGCVAAARFEVTFPAGVLEGEFTGKCVVYVSTGKSEPRFGPNWFNPQPMYSNEFEKVGPGDVMVIDSKATGFPASLDKLPSGEYTVQAVVDRNLGGREIGSSPGNLYSKPQRLSIDASTGTIKLVCDQVVADEIFRETDAIKASRLRSDLLSKFYERPTMMRAAVVLPESWANSGRTYPVIYTVPGFGGSFLNYSGRSERNGTVRDGEEFIVVYLDPTVPTGHCVFADSANNGPWGTALVKEFIPFIEKTYRGYGKSEGRFVTGHSSGGWSSLWLQVTYPEFFGGTWSTSPDPVDFRDFQRIDLYKPGVNMFTDESGKPRPIARRGDDPILFFKQFSDMERPIRGEQLGSFEAVFSPKGRDGKPVLLWNRFNGAVNNDVAQAWRKYDIGHILRSNWKDLGPKLKGKLHVYMGTQDTFYLEGATELLQKDLKAMGSDATVELLPGDHGSVLTSSLRRRIDKQMADAWRNR
jgi:hypothetical protein